MPTARARARCDLAQTCQCGGCVNTVRRQAWQPLPPRRHGGTRSQSALWERRLMGGCAYNHSPRSPNTATNGAVAVVLVAALDIGQERRGTCASPPSRGACRGAVAWSRLHRALAAGQAPQAEQLSLRAGRQQPGATVSLCHPPPCTVRRTQWAGTARTAPSLAIACGTWGAGGGSAAPRDRRDGCCNGSAAAAQASSTCHHHHPERLLIEAQWLSNVLAWAGQLRPRRLNS
jgi:hypothetical protein